jgi:hypothetical protein
VTRSVANLMFRCSLIAVALDMIWVVEATPQTGRKKA